MSNAPSGRGARLFQALAQHQQQEQRQQQQQTANEGQQNLHFRPGSSGSSAPGRVVGGRARILALLSTPGGVNRPLVSRPTVAATSSSSSRSSSVSSATGSRSRKSKSSSCSSSSRSSSSSSSSSIGNTGGSIKSTRSGQSSRGSSEPENLAGRLNRKSSESSTHSSESVASQNFANVSQTIKAPIIKEPSKQGQPIQLSVNYVRFEREAGKQVYEYDVKFEPQIESIQLRGKLLKSPEITSKIGTIMQWSGTNLYLPIKTEKRVTEFQVKHPVLADVSVKVSLIFIKIPLHSELLPFYNGLMHKAMNCLRMVLINRHYYSDAGRLFVPQHKLEIWPGWVTSIQELDGGVLLSCDASFRILRTQSALDAMREIHRSAASGNFRDEVSRAFVGSIVMTRYNNKAYRVDDIAFDMSPKSTFMRGDSQTTYVDYFREHWNVQINDVNQPLFIHREKKRRGVLNPAAGDEPKLISLIPELCIVTGLSDSMRSDFSVMREIASHTRLKPELRYQKMQEFLEHLNNDQRALKVFTDWNLRVDREQLSVTGRRLQCETLHFGNGRSHVVPDNADWTRQATTGKLLVGVNIEGWVIVYSNRDASVAQEFAMQIANTSRSMGFSMGAPRRVCLQSDQPVAYLKGIKDELKPDDQLVVILTPGKAQREDRYNAVKRLLSCDMPVASQVLRCGTFQGPKCRSVAQKIAIQIASKVGGQPWGIRVPLTNTFMVVGIDVYHDSLDKKRSCVGFVASTNAQVSQWYSRTFFQNAFDEICAKLKQVMIDAIRKYQSINGAPPEQIFIYRDGVGDGQLAALIEFEVAQIVDAIRCASDIKNYNPRVSYILVQKRISAKMILKSPTSNSGNSFSNPLPGSVLDHSITHPHYNDFYLVSQHVNQGTVSPTKYIILAETGTMKPEHHQKMAYKMTHMYFNWCGTIRVPAPCQYAHKLAYLVGQNIRQEPSDRLCNKLYYL